VRAPWRRHYTEIYPPRLLYLASPRTHSVLGNLALKRNDLARAETEFASAADIDQLYGDDDYRAAFATANLTDVIEQERQHLRAERVAGPALKVLKEHPLPGDITTGIGKVTLGQSLFHQQCYPEAVAPFNRAYQILEEGPSSSAALARFQRGKAI
jgi:tetratricopeptide (TPR) repeat protein